MAHYGLLRDYRFDDLNTEDDIRGSYVYGRDDEKLGKIDDVIFDHATGAIRFVVVDTGGWFTHKKFLVPPHRLHSSAEHEKDFTVNLDKSQIETLPRYDESDVESDARWKQYEKQYDEAWHIPAGSDEVTIQNSAIGIGSRWLTFEERLRARRRDITRACTTCTVGPASDRSSESAAQERKAV